MGPQWHLKFLNDYINNQILRATPLPAWKECGKMSALEWTASTPISTRKAGFHFILPIFPGPYNFGFLPESINHFRLIVILCWAVQNFYTALWLILFWNPSICNKNVWNYQREAESTWSVYLNTKSTKKVLIKTAPYSSKIKKNDFYNPTFHHSRNHFTIEMVRYMETQPSAFVLCVVLYKISLEKSERWKEV